MFFMAGILFVKNIRVSITHTYISQPTDVTNYVSPFEQFRQHTPNYDLFVY